LCAGQAGESAEVDEPGEVEKVAGDLCRNAGEAECAALGEFEEGSDSI
jgi:hypothetical protein